jgi:DedD protein
MAQEDKHNDSRELDPSDEATQLKKRARRRLIGAMALALLAAVTLPMVMDHKPAPPLKDIQVRIPSPDEGVTQRMAPKPKQEKLAPPAEPVAPIKPSVKEEMTPQPAKPVEKSETKPITKPEPKPEPKVEPKPEVKPEDKAATESWEVQLGAYQNPASVTILVGKLKQLGIPTYTEKVETPAGARTRVRAGPFPSQESAENARTRIKIVGVDGPVVRKP